MPQCGLGTLSHSKFINDPRESLYVFYVLYQELCEPTPTDFTLPLENDFCT